MKLLLVLAFVLVAIKGQSDDDDVPTHFKKAGIIPELIDDAPREQAKVEFFRGGRARLGNQFTASQVKEVPDISYRPSPYDDRYCVIIVGLNHPENAKCPKGTHYLHACYQNVLNDDVFGVNPVVDYNTSPPTNGTVVFLVLEQNRARNFKAIEKRTCFNTKQFMDDNNLRSYAGNDIKVVPK